MIQDKQTIAQFFYQDYQWYKQWAFDFFSQAIKMKFA